MVKTRKGRKAVCCRFKDVNFIEKRLLKDYTAIQIIRDLDNVYPSHNLTASNIRYHRDMHFKPKIKLDLGNAPLNDIKKSYAELSKEYIDPMIAMHQSLHILHHRTLKLNEDAERYGYVEANLLKYLKATVEASEKLITLKIRLNQKEQIQETSIDQKILTYVDNRQIVEEKAKPVINRRKLTKVFSKLENPMEETLFDKSNAVTEELLMRGNDTDIEEFSIDMVERRAEKN